jgi:hypothetical protein
MASYTVNKIYFPETPVVNQTVSMYYKLTTDSVVNYTLVGTGIVVGTNGVPVSPPVINGLIEELSYDILVYNNTCSPAKDWVQTITVPS